MLFYLTLTQLHVTALIFGVAIRQTDPLNELFKNKSFFIYPVCRRGREMTTDNEVFSLSCVTVTNGNGGDDKTNNEITTVSKNVFCLFYVNI